MSRSLWISGSLACLVIGAGFLFADNDAPAAKPKPAAVAAKPPAPATPPVRVVWPTPYPYFENKADDLAYLQATESGVVASGGYGMIRNGGARFHEGIDIRPVSRDRKGEATDPVVAALSGRVVYINTAPNGAYGRYIVLEHAVGGVTLYTLYGHLASVNPALITGRAIAAGAALGIMGRSNGEGGFPKVRAHLHFEIGLRLSGNFARWYAEQRYPDANKHGEYNGINLAGLNPAGFFRFARDYRGEMPPEQLARWVRAQPVAVTVETKTRFLPDIVRRNPALVTGGKPYAAPGWRIGFTADGVPVTWQPLATTPPAMKIIMVETSLALEARRRGLITSVRGKNTGYKPGSTLEKALELTLE